METTKEVITTPTEFFRRMNVTGGIGAPLVYGVIAGYVGMIAQALCQVIFSTVMGRGPSPFGDRPEFQRFVNMMLGTGGLVGQVLLGPVFIVMVIFILSGIYHLMLLLLDGAKKDFEATFRVVSYSEAAALFGIIPVCGGLIGGIYQLVLMIIGLSEARGIGRGKAAAAVLIPILACCCCFAGIVAMAYGGLAAALEKMR